MNNPRQDKGKCNAIIQDIRNTASDESVFVKSFNEFFVNAVKGYFGLKPLLKGRNNVSAMNQIFVTKTFSRSICNCLVLQTSTQLGIYKYKSHLVNIADILRHSKNWDYFVFFKLGFQQTNGRVIL